MNIQPFKRSSHAANSSQHAVGFQYLPLPIAVEIFRLNKYGAGGRSHRPIIFRHRQAALLEHRHLLSSLPLPGELGLMKARGFSCPLFRSRSITIRLLGRDLTAARPMPSAAYCSRPCHRSGCGSSAAPSRQSCENRLETRIGAVRMGRRSGLK